MKRKEVDESPRPRPNARQQQPPDYPYILALTQTQGWGTQPIHFRAGLTEKFEREYCPHLAGWKFMGSAEQEEPPCSLRLSDRNVKGCPSAEERECGVYAMHRCVGYSPGRARKTKGLPFDQNPKPDENPLRKPPADPPAWVTD